MRDEKKGGLMRGKRKGECFPYVGVKGLQRMCVLFPHLSMTRLTKKGRQWTARAVMIAAYSRRRNQTKKQVSGKVSRNQITDIPTSEEAEKVGLTKESRKRSTPRVGSPVLASGRSFGAGGGAPDIGPECMSSSCPRQSHEVERLFCGARRGRSNAHLAARGYFRSKKKNKNPTTGPSKPTLPQKKKKKKCTKKPRGCRVKTSRGEAGRTGKGD